MLIFVGTNSCKKISEHNKINPHALLSDDKYSKLVVEIQSFEGQEPDANTLENIRTFLEARLNKPDGISLVSNTINPERASKYSLSEIEKLEQKNRTIFSSNSKASIYFLFVDGEFADNANGNVTLGVAYGASSMVIFENSIKQLSGGFGQPSTTILESTVSLHEIGHLLGLVNNGSNMSLAHEDTDHARHCNNNNCLMFWQSETSDFIKNFFGSIPALDENCIKDLQKNGGK